MEPLLADCHVRRSRAAVMAFRGAGAELLLPPTRSLARAKRSLADLVIATSVLDGLALDYRGTVRAIPPGDYSLKLLPGLCRMLAVRNQLAGENLLSLVAWLLAAGVAHSALLDPGAATAVASASSTVAALPAPWPSFPPAARCLRPVA
ncbi:hypothetical protein GHT07_15890 [Caenimonas koreensis DSM 17982]|uniref:Uncharacterized protein n=1 Tax=Caenimonas koreensis DSM 17982 TaxID=1121255 RepID=A0A844AW86_9BURK|nr:hypothetical protein [Caenimonas koreensis]MRD48770.1 hypothetical protein [Caenimonas koreensis DSM 17982]